MHIVSLVIGLSVAFSAALAMGGWQTDASIAGSSRPILREPAAALSSLPAPTPRSANAPRFLLVLVNTREEVEPAFQRHADANPGWEVDIISTETAIATAELPAVMDALNESLRLGHIREFKVVDERRRRR